LLHFTKPITRPGSSLVAPILKCESADARELSRVVRYDLQTSPQGTSRKKQVIRPYGRALTVQTRAQLRRHTGVFTLERQNGNRIQNDAHRFPHTRRETRIPRKSVLDFHLGNHRNGQLRRSLLTNTRNHALFSACEVAQYISVQKKLHEKASSRGANNSPRYDSNGGISGTPCHSRIGDGQPGLPSAPLS